MALPTPNAHSGRGLVYNSVASGETLGGFAAGYGSVPVEEYAPRVTWLSRQNLRYMVPRLRLGRQILTLDPASTSVSAVALFSKPKQIASGIDCEIRSARVTLDPELSSACYSSNVDELTPALSLPSSIPDTRPGLVSATPTDTSIVTILRRPVLPAWFAGLQVGAVCGFPTMIFVSIVLILGTQMPILDGGNPTLEYIAMSGLLDTALIALLIRVFLMLSGETSRNVFLGPPSPRGGGILR